MVTRPTALSLVDSMQEHVCTSRRSGVVDRHEAAYFAKAHLRNSPEGLDKFASLILTDSTTS